MTFLLSFVILSLGAIQGILVSLFLLRNKSRHSSDIFFTFLIIVITLQLIFKVLSKGWLWYNVNFVYLQSYNLPYLIGPLLYLFIRHRVNKCPFKASDLLHFVPFVFGSLITSMEELFNFNFAWFPWNPLPWSARHLISLFAYGFFSWRLLKDEKNYKELKSFLAWGTISEAIIIIAITFMLYAKPDQIEFRMLFGVLTILIYWISYKLLQNPSYFSVQPVGVTVQAYNPVKYAHSGLKVEEANRIAALIHEAIHTKKVFLEPDISIEAFAKNIGVPKHHVSRVINERYSKNYVDLANGWRLEEACARLSNPALRQHTISRIALDSGFNSVSSFDTIFKRRFQVTPTKFRDKNLKRRSA